MRRLCSSVTSTAAACSPSWWAPWNSLTNRSANWYVGLFNKFRGDPTLLTSGLQWLEEKYRRPVFGVLPYLHDLDLAEEDSLPHRPAQFPSNGALLRPPPRGGFAGAGVDHPRGRS